MRPAIARGLLPAVGFLLSLVPACYAPEPKSGVMQCSDDHRCPRGYFCAQELCWKDGSDASISGEVQPEAPADVTSLGDALPDTLPDTLPPGDGSPDSVEAGPGPAALSITPSAALLTTQVRVGQAGTDKVTFTVKNGGDLPVMPAVARSGDVADFTINDTCGLTPLAKGASCIIEAVLVPTTRGTKTLTLTPAGAAAASVTGSAYEAYVLSVTKPGAGSGTVVAQGPTGTDFTCGATCSATYNVVDTAPVVTVSATPDAVSALASVSGAGCTSLPCQITMSQARNLTVNFSAQPSHQLQIGVTGLSGATGTVTVNGSYVSCGTGCYRAVAGTVLTATAMPSPMSGANRPFFASWTNGPAGCGTMGICIVTMDRDWNLTAGFSPANVIFVTEGTFTYQDLAAHAPASTPGPLAGADQICKDEAAGKLGSRKFVSLLTTGGAAPATRLESARGFVRPDGEPFGEAPASFMRPQFEVYYPPRVLATGESLSQFPAMPFVAIGTGCTDWTSASGLYAAGAPVWGGGGWDGPGQLEFQCDAVQGFRLYCASVDYQVTVAPPAPEGNRLAFVTKGTWKPGGGIAAADAVCSAEATAASLPSPATFKAFLATTTSSALGRFDTSRPTWYRVDGVQIVPTPAALGVWPVVLKAPIQVTADRKYVDYDSVFTGADTPTSLAASTSNCNDWTSSASSAGYAGMGVALRTGPDFAWAGELTCTYAGHLYCLQE